MQNDNITDFDLEFRKMFQDAEEAVPSHVWDSLSKELDRKAERKVVALPWWRAAACVAAAAAVISGVVIFTGHPDTSTVPSQVVAEATPVEETLPDTPSIEEQIALSSQLFLADIPEAGKSAQAPVKPFEVVPADSFEYEAPEDAVATVDEPAAENKTDAPDYVASGNADKAEKSSEVPVWTDPFDLLPEEDAKEKHEISFSLSGNVMSNDATGSSSRIAKAPVIGDGILAGQATTGVAEKSVSAYGIPLSLGIGAQISLTDRWSVGSGINWALLSRSFTGIYTETDGRIVTKSINANINNEIHYIGIPLNFYYNVLTNRNLKFYAWGGGMAEKGLVNKYRIHSEPEDIFYSERVKGIQWSAGLGLGLEFTLNDYLGLYIDPSARYYFDCDQPASVRTQKPYMLNFEVGLRFNL